MNAVGRLLFLLVIIDAISIIKTIRNRKQFVENLNEIRL